jgi:hypothetical protein
MCRPSGPFLFGFPFPGPDGPGKGCFGPFGPVSQRIRNKTFNASIIVMPGGQAQPLPGPDGPGMLSCMTQRPEGPTQQSRRSVMSTHQQLLYHIDLLQKHEIEFDQSHVWD